MNASNQILLIFCLLPVALLLLFLAVLRKHRKKPSASLLVAGNVVMLLLLISLALPVGEAYYRFAYDTTDGWHIGLVSHRWIERHYRFNNFNVRDTIDYAMAVAPGKTRVSFMGDSFTNGHGIPDVEDRFANLTRRTNPDWEVHVLASDGRDAGAILEELRRLLGAGYEIQDVVYVYCLNDIADIVDEWKAAASRVYGEKLGFFLANSYLLNTYYYRQRVSDDRELQSYFDYVGKAYFDSRWDDHVRRLEDLEQLISKNGGKLLVVTFPFFERMDTEPYRAIHEKLAAYWRERGIPYLDLREHYREFPMEDLVVSRHDTHPNEDAHALAAETISRFIRAEQ